MKRLLLAVALSALGVAGASAEDLAVAKDQSRVIRLTGEASTIVVGNPAIADVTMQDASTAFVTGKGFGTTNVIAMDATGRQIASFRIVVTSTADRSVTVIKGQQQITLSCAPRCEQTAETKPGS